MKNLVKIGFVVVFAAVTGYGIYTSQKTDSISDLVLANVEALAQYESSGDCKGCTINVLMICKDWGWGGCIGNPMYHPA